MDTLPVHFAGEGRLMRQAPAHRNCRSKALAILNQIKFPSRIFPMITINARPLTRKKHLRPKTI